MDIGHEFLHSLKDCIYMLPIMFITYVIIELIERKTSFATNGKFLSGKVAPVFGSLLGTVPQCGVSVMSAKLFDKGIIGLGTLLSVFIATSDEAFSILIASDKRLDLIPLLIIKLVLATLVGLMFNLILSKKKNFEGEVFEHDSVCAHCHDGVEEGKHAWVKMYVLVPLFHALQTFLYVFAVTFLFGIFFGEHGIIGEEKFAVYLSSVKYTESFITALIGLIPNCASSAIITGAYVSGGISFGSLVAGLISNAGVGLAVLFKNVKEIKRNLFILFTLYFIGAFTGLFITLVSGLF
ncbi:MAG: arsenic efflux protein [Clostridia bacterium]|nr:arsenic efflux protein [Clostridia bacterium]